MYLFVLYNDMNTQAVTLFQVLVLEPNSCHWVSGSTSDFSVAIELYYTIPIEGHVSNWFTEKRKVPGLTSSANAKHNWHIPAAKLLRIAKVQLKDPLRLESIDMPVCKLP